MYEIRETRKASKKSLGKPPVVKIVFILATLAISVITGANLASSAQAQQQQQPQQETSMLNWLAFNEAHAAKGGNLSTVSHTGNNTSRRVVKGFLNQTGKVVPVISRDVALQLRTIWLLQV